jgi:hypothetical protein
VQSPLRAIKAWTWAMLWELSDRSYDKAPAHCVGSEICRQVERKEGG